MQLPLKGVVPHHSSLALRQSSLHTPVQMNAIMMMSLRQTVHLFLGG